MTNRFMLVGCLSLVGVGAVGGWFAWRWWDTEARPAIAREADRALVQAVDESQLSADDKEKVKVRIHAVMEDFKAGKMSVAVLARAAEELQKSPLLAAAGVQIAADTLVTMLPDSVHRTAARRSTERFLRGIADGTISQNAAQDFIGAVAEKDHKGEWQVRKTVDARVAATQIANLKKAADDAHIPDEPFKVDYVGEFSRIIDTVLAERDAKQAKDSAKR